MARQIDKTVFRTPVKSTEGKVIHLYKQMSGITTTFDPDIQDGANWDQYRKGSTFVCGEPYHGVNDLVTHLPAKVTCPGCKNG